jgi:ubiquinone/menaquinone biosynthesis C-methylase UbiE
MGKQSSDDKAALKALLSLKQSLIDSNWAQLGCVLGISKKLRSNEGKKPLEKLEALNRACLESSWLRIGAALGMSRPKRVLAQAAQELPVEAAAEAAPKKEKDQPVEKENSVGPTPPPHDPKDGLNKSNTEYWSDHNVTFHTKYKSRQESLDYIEWRNSLYFDYDNMMPCSGWDGKVCLDYGCGPGHDTIALTEKSKPAKVYAVDISPTSLGEAKARSQLHRPELVEWIQIKDGTASLPVESDSVDYIHSSGVLHHTPNEFEILLELKRILKPGGVMRVMMYNYNSLFVHLHVAYSNRLKLNIDADCDFTEALRRASDFGCPIVRFYTPQQFIAICEKAGFMAKLVGVSISTFELKMAPLRFEAIEDMRLPMEQRQFLGNLTFDHKGQPLHNGDVAGIDAVYELTK